ncbi:MAG: hypothetical protein A2096_11440 [Spirochaetes bacterium GWF1_41_5]|nr:MAG: hypothetical protein A2096_11440 [Spirochaetes bacterium GWF1_41_5]HBE02935.1 hypothetical protein [Spirochaetia bacterium]
MSFSSVIDNRAQDTIVVKLTGDLDLYQIEQFKKQMTETINGGVKKIIFDFESLNYIDSSGLGGIITCMQLMRSKNGAVTIAGLKDSPRRVFELTNIDKLFKIYADVDSALAAAN